MAEKGKIILTKRETPLESWKTDSSTLVAGLALVAIGLVVDSSAMQWMGAFVWAALVISQANKKTTRLTIPEARKWLDDMEATPNE